jgi:hypothetical protein
MTIQHQPIATLLVGAEGTAETEGEPWIRPATAEEQRAFIEQACKGDEGLYRDSLVDGTGRPYFLLTVLDNAPESVQAKAKRCARCLRLTE